MSQIDILSTLNGRGIDTGAVVTVTGNKTLDASALNKIIYCSGFSSDGTVVLPPVSASKGKGLVVCIDGGMNALATLDGNASETINGAASRVMWKHEVAELWCNGSEWKKVGGLTMPMSAGIYLSANQTFAASATWDLTTINLDTSMFTPSVYSMVDTANKRLVIPRTSRYTAVASLRSNDNNSSNHTILLDAVDLQQWQNTPASSYNAMIAVNPGLSKTAGSFMYMKVAYSTGSYSTTVLTPAAHLTFLKIVEDPQW